MGLVGPLIFKIREVCDPLFLLNDSENSNTFHRLKLDSALVCGVLHIICSKQRLERNIKDATFYSDVIGDGDTIQLAVEAMVQAMLFFSPPQTRKMMKLVAEKTDQIEKKAMDMVATKMSNPNLETELLEGLEAEMDRVINRALMPQGSVTS